MTVDPRQPLRVVALLLAGFVGTIHLWWGLPRFVERFVRYGYYLDPRPIVFVLTVVLLIAGIAYVGMGGERKLVYVGGIALMFAYLTGYFWWHLSGHGGTLPWFEGHGHSHYSSLTGFVVEHARSETIAMVSKAAEALTIVVLSALLYLEYHWPDGEVRSTGPSHDTPAEPSGSADDTAVQTDGVPE